MTGVGMPVVGVALAWGVELLRGTVVGEMRVGMGVGSVELRKAEGPIKLKTKLSTITRLNAVVTILTLRLLRF
jgi:hypothetical protein